MRFAVVVALTAVRGVIAPAPIGLARTLGGWRRRGRCSTLHRELMKDLALVIHKLSLELLEVTGELVESEASHPSM